MSDPTKAAPLLNRVAGVVSHASWAIPAVVGLVFVLVFPLVSGTYSQRQVVMIMIYTLIVAGFNLTFGYAGDLALGQVAMFATGAYVTSIMASHGIDDIGLAVLASALGAVVIGLISGAPGVRLSGWSLAITSLFVVFLVPRLVIIGEAETGGRQGLSAAYRPTLFGLDLKFTGFFIFAGLLTLGWLLLMRSYVTSSRGRALQLLKSSRELTMSVGHSPYRMRISAYILGSIPAGIAGTVYAYLVGFVSPEAFTITVAIAILAAAVVGGSASVWGAPLGAAILVLGPLQTSEFEQFSIIIYGLFLLAAGLLFAKGIAGLAQKALDKFGGPLGKLKEIAVRRELETLDLEAEAFNLPGVRLDASEVTKSFGGVPALRGALITAEPGQITAILGANGAGKTTFLNTVSGFVRADAGAIRLGEQEIVGLSANDLSRHGLARTFQTPQIPDDLSVLDVVLSARDHAQPGLFSTVFRLPAYRRFRRESLATAWKALSFAGLEDLAFEDAISLPLGTRRLLEVVRAAASNPGLLMLDEPAAGLDDKGLEDLARLARLISDSGGSVIIVEHNVPFVLKLADRIHVMELGQTIASGTPEEIVSNPTVIASYLGGTVVDAASTQEDGDA